MKRRTVPVAAVLLSACLLHGVTSAEPSQSEFPREVHHAQGTTTIPAVPKRVVVMDLASLDNFDTLGIPVVGVPELASHMFPEWLSEYASDDYAKVGSLFEPDVDAIKKLNPDLIVVASRSSGKLDTLASIAPTIDLSTTTSGFVASTVQNLLTIGTIFDQQELANQKAIELLQNVRELHTDAATRGTGLLLFSVRDSIIPQPPATRFGVIHELIGMPSVMTKADAGPPRQKNKADDAQEQTPEQIAQAEARKREQAKKDAKRLQMLLDRDPQWLISLDRNSAFGERESGAEVLQSRTAVTESGVWRSKKVIYLDGRGWYLAPGGAQQLQHAIDTIQNAFDQHSQN
ncbi:MAG: siderophore ABC transporter substrate-binding protein [Rhodopirellula sp. JB055]|uniref:siderophore ABC transporter substrate-binding protein n=1 Tax=Rhodopirellula sp. JB055 TaxID=3342846 RepID=UPI00370C0AF2